VTIRLKFGKDSALHFGHFALAAHINLKSLCLLCISYYSVTNLPERLQFTCSTLQVS